MPEENPRPSLWVRFRSLSQGRQLLIALIVLLVAAFALSVIRTMFYGSMGLSSDSYGVTQTKTFNSPVPSVGMMRGVSVDEMYAVSDSASMPMEYPQYDGGTGVYEESAYETRSYRATFKTASLDATCNRIESWKPRPDVVFEKSSRTERSCSYTLKVARAGADGVLRDVEAMDPTDISADVVSAKRQMVQYDGQLTILLRKQKELQDMLDSAVAAYDELVTFSKDAQNVEVLSRVIDSKLAQIERLTAQRIALAQQLQALTQQIADIEDKIEFVYFNLYVQKYEIIDGDAVKDSWIAALKNFTVNVNATLQNLTLGLLLNLLMLAQVVLYLLMLLVVMKYGWKNIVRFWKA